jgi:hypothetical protein
MDFRTAVLQASKSAKLNARQRAKVDDASGEKHPRLWNAIESWTAWRYERDTGKKPPMKAGAIDWSKIMDWLVANMPAIIKMIMVLFSL